MTDEYVAPPKLRFSDDRFAAVVQAAYGLSKPQGLGFLHFTEGGLPDAEVEEMRARSLNNRFGLSMDYVHGRAVKMSIRRDADGYYLEDNGRWFDHGQTAWEALKEVASFKP